GRHSVPTRRDARAVQRLLGVDRPRARVQRARRRVAHRSARSRLGCGHRSQAERSSRLSAGPLSWLRVVDSTDLRGALCARILADLGADVVRVERSSVDESLAYRYRNLNKRVVSLEGPAHLDELLADADVFVDNLALAPDAVA